MLEIVITILGLIQGILAYLNKRSNWIVYAIQMFLLVIFSYYNSLYGDMTQNILYFLFCIVGYFLWDIKSKYNKITLCTNKQYIIGGFILVISVLGGWYWLSITDDPLPFTDSFTTITTLFGVVLLMFKKLETWIIWFVNDIAYMYEYFMLPNQALYLFGLYCVWTCLAVGSFINWYKIYKQQDKRDNMFVMEVIEGEF